MRFFLIYFILVFVFQTMANCQQVSVFKTLTVKDGLPSNYVFDASEDENGFLWIGTDKGLAKYDGFAWQLVNTDNGLEGNYVNTVKCDGKAGIWLSIAAKGIFYYSIATKKISKVTNRQSQGGFKMNKEGEIFIEEFFNATNTYCLLSFSPENNFKEKLICEAIIKPTIDALKEINIDLNNKVITHFEAFDNKIADGWKIVKQKSDTKKILWSNNLDSVFELNGNVTIRNKGIITTKQLFKKSKYFFYTNANNQFYFWNIQDGFWAIDINGNSKHYTNADGLATNLVNNILITKKKELLICTLGGGLQMLLATNNVKINTAEKQVRAISVYKNEAYVCTENKLFIIDLLQKKEVKKIDLNENTIESISITENEIAIASLTGVNFYSKNSSNFFKTKSIKLTAGVSTILNTEKNYLLSTYGNGVEILDKSKKPLLIKYVKENTVLEKLQELKNGYAGLTYEDGVHFFNKNVQFIKTLSKKNGLLSNEIYDVHEYKDSLWISTAKGISIYTNNKVVKNIPLTSNTKTENCIYSFHNKEGKYWLVTSKGLLEYYNGKLFEVGSYTLTKNEGDLIKTVFYDGMSNTLIAGSNNEISLLNMSNIVRDTNVIAPSLLFAKADGDTTSLKNNFSLPYNFKVVSFSLISAISNPFSQTNMLYRLEGFNETYQYFSDSAIINFEKLRPGNYTLLAKTKNIDGYESGEIKLIKFEINKPFWLQAWFIIFSAIATISTSLLLFNYFQRKKQVQKDKENALALSVSKERERISKDLHDHLGTSLVTMIAQTDNIENKLINNNVQDALLKVQQLSDQSRESMNVLRETIWAVQENSHTLNEFTLRVRTFLQRVMDAYEMSWALESNGTLQKDLSAEQTLHLFRMIQEVTQNILKHAAATHAQYKIDANSNSLKITITDDGKGFDTNASYTSNGLKNLATRIKELDGNINITSTIKKGTTIIVQLSI